MTSLYPVLTSTNLSGISVQKADIHMNSNWTIPVSDSRSYKSAVTCGTISLLSVCIKSTAAAAQSVRLLLFPASTTHAMPRCYEVPPTLWRPNSFFRVRWAPYGPALAPTIHSPVNASWCEAVQSEVIVLSMLSWGSKFVSLPFKCLK